LKHFKDRLGRDGVPPSQESGTATCGPSPFDLESFIIYRCVVGSRAYGLDDDDSDTDRRGIYLAPADLQWSLFGAPEQFEDNATQSCYWELQKFLAMALKANPNILECLYSPMVEKVTSLAEELLALRRQFLSQMIFQTFNGYAMSQFKKIEQDIRNHGEVRWKHACTCCACYSPARPRCAKAACPSASRRTANDCLRSNATKCRGPKWTPGARSFTAISSALWRKQNCPNARLRISESTPHQSAAGNGEPTPLLNETIRQI
jgi:hypothetical protein